MNNLPLNLQNTKFHKTNIISILYLVQFGVFCFGGGNNLFILDSILM